MSERRVTSLSPLEQRLLPVAAIIAVEVDRRGHQPGTPAYNEAVQRLIRLTTLVHPKVLRELTQPQEDHED